jgi:hypothetical protein
MFSFVVIKKANVVVCNTSRHFYFFGQDPDTICWDTFDEQKTVTFLQLSEVTLGEILV